MTDTLMDKRDLSLVEYGSRDDIVALGQRIKSLLPSANTLSNTQAMALAQYALALDANPFRGEVYGYTDRHGFHLVDGYKLLVRWARDQCNYVETYKPLDKLPNGSIGYRCYILREDARPFLREMLQGGASFERAFDIAAVSAVGVVTKADMTTKNGGAMDPPKGWTWDQVARKRALKNALNLSHGAPSLREIAAESWRVDDVTTIPDDWRDVTPEMLLGEREAIAIGNARIREAHEGSRELAEGGATAEDAIVELFGDYIDSNGPPPPNPPAETPKPLNNKQAHRAFNELIGSATRHGYVSQDRANELGQMGATRNWRDALEMLQIEIDAAQEHAR